MTDDPILLALVGIGLLLNVLSIKPLKQLKYRKWIKVLTLFSLCFGFIVLLFVLIVQSSTPLTRILFYVSMFFWNAGFFEIIFILIVRPNKISD